MPSRGDKVSTQLGAVGKSGTKLRLTLHRTVAMCPAVRESDLIASAGQELNIAQGREGRVAIGRQDFTLLLWAK